ncbi:MAG: glycerophosphodiester phosphodiesterase [Methanomicrobiales archaeon]|nr:glycerophosphodiester phosphodiesterase [Methanomicrobiales archaeon]
MFIIGHRGAKAIEPENTLRAVREGMRCADYIEIDARLSRDGIPVVMHDATVDRTTDGRGAVSSFTLAELRTLDAGGGERIPTLEEVCREIRGSCGLVCEIKEPGSEEAVCGVLAREAPEDLWIVSFHAGCISAAHDLIPAAETGLIVSRMAGDLPGQAADLGAGAILLKYDLLSPDLIAACRDLGLKVISWTLNTPAEFEHAAGLGIDGLASDNPCAARQYFGRT